ncbi:hypothetical protein [Micromonospora sp. WMMD812]|uniref:hypothetical protein n=1 Tax=Micromonospora sp. WMMD812 TaxID=3015152 RepID=UPI00248BF75E|nr:hypothetical protein [Micromonospora sp. WMMD812]WBB66667.1 hypothetical protein O7603_26530 [Micromonospora sp. WMMD812]
MSMRFMTKLAGGVVLGSAALLLGAPATAFAGSEEPTKEPVNSNQEQAGKSDSNHEQKTFSARDKEGNGIICATNKQSNEQKVGDILKDNTIKNSVVTFNLQVDVSQQATNQIENNSIVVCIRDLDVEVDVETRLLYDLLALVEGAGTPVTQPAGDAPAVGGATDAPAVGGATDAAPAVGGATAGPAGAWVAPANGAVAAGDGALADADTGSLTTIGASMMGMGVLGGLGLLRRRSAGGTVA